MNKPKDTNVPVPKASTSKDSDDKRKKDEEDSDQKAFESFLSEVETDMRDEALSNAWKKYSAHIVGGAVAIILGVFGYQLYVGHVEERRDNMAMSYADAAAAIEAGDTESALAKFGEIADVPGEGYSTVARLAEASLLVGSGDVEGALSIYEALAAGGAVDPVFQDLAVVLKATHSMETADPGALEAELAQVSGPGQPFRHSALEISAVLAAKQGAHDRALDYLSQILDDPEAPPAMRSRVRDLSDLYANDSAPAQSEESPDETAPASS